MAEDNDQAWLRPPPVGPPMREHDGAIMPAPLGVDPYARHPAGPGFEFNEENPDGPRWGMGDIALGAVVTLLAAGAASLGFLGIGLFLDEIETDAEGLPLTPLWVTALALVVQQTVQGLWPIIVTKWKGTTARADWRLRFSWSDLPLGIGIGFGALVVAGLAGQLVAELVGINAEDASNTDIITDAEGSPWRWVLIASVVVGAPIAEELFFRGLCLRAIEKRFGLAIGLIGSVILFTLPHFVGGTARETITTFASIAVVGLILGLAVIATDRLGTAIVAHMTFNGFVASVLVSDFDSAMAWTSAFTSPFLGR